MDTLRESGALRSTLRRLLANSLVFIPGVMSMLLTPVSPVRTLVGGEYLSMRRSVLLAGGCSLSLTAGCATYVSQRAAAHAARSCPR